MNNFSTIQYGSKTVNCSHYRLSGIDIFVVPFFYRLSEELVVEWLNIIFKNLENNPVSIYPTFYPIYNHPIPVLEWILFGGNLIIDNLLPGEEKGIGFLISQEWIELDLSLGKNSNCTNKYMRDESKIIIGQRSESRLWSEIANEMETKFWDPSNASSCSHQEVRFLADTVISSIEKEPSLLTKLRPSVFERLVAEVFARSGFEVSVTARSKDGGVDIYAISRPNLISTSHLIQCKRYRNKIGIEFVRELFAVKTDIGANQGILVTTSSFTGPAIEFSSRHSWELSLVDGKKLINWIRSVNSS